jgi:hypothetical protein
MKNKRGFVRSFYSIAVLVSLVFAGFAHADSQVDFDGFDDRSSPRVAAFVDRSIEQQWAKFRDRMVFELEKASDSLCGIPFVPHSVSLTAEVIKVKWELKDLCAPRGRSLLASRAATVRFENATYDAGLLAAESPRKMQDFVRSVSEFICRFPVRPTEVDLKIPPVAIDWNVAVMCRGL